jgi:hypothetical protein
MPDLRPSPLDLAGKVAARLRGRGFAEVFGLAVERLREGIYSDGGLLVLVRPAAPENVSLNGFSFKEANESDSGAYARDIATDSVRSFKSRLAGGIRCFVVTSGERIVHATWSTTRAAWTREVRSYFRPPAGDAYVYESFTRAEVRGRGVYPFALRSISSTLAADGSKRLWVAVETDNPASHKAVEKAGFEVAFEIAYRRRGGVLRVEEPTGGYPEVARSFMSSAP